MTKKVLELKKIKTLHSLNGESKIINADGFEVSEFFVAVFKSKYSLLKNEEYLLEYKTITFSAKYLQEFVEEKEFIFNFIGLL